MSNRVKISDGIERISARMKTLHHPCDLGEASRQLAYAAERKAGIDQELSRLILINPDKSRNNDNSSHTR